MGDLERVLNSQLLRAIDVVSHDRAYTLELKKEENIKMSNAVGSYNCIAIHIYCIISHCITSYCTERCCIILHSPIHLSVLSSACRCIPKSSFKDS